jgi:Flp pilus assembly protein TadD
MARSMSKLTPTFLLLGIALVLWSASAGLSHYLARDFEREHGSKKGLQQAQSAPSSEDFAKLQKEGKENPKDVDVQLRLGYAQVQEAYQSSNGALLMDAVKTFQGVLELSPENPDALLGLASLCLQNGILDKALDYYPRYLAKRPDDIRAKTDYALVNFRADKFEEGKKLVDEILTKEPSFFPAHMVMAFAYRMNGRIDEARSQAMNARGFAPNETLRTEVDAFIAGLDNPQQEASAEGTSQPAATSERAAPEELQSPAMKIESFVKNHTILGPKFRGLEWEGETLVHIKLEQFPVEQMPPFAKQVFISKTKSALRELSDAVKLRFIDAETSKELLVVSVGGEIE